MSENKTTVIVRPGDPDNYDATKYYVIRDLNIVAVEDLKTRLATLEAEVAELKKRLEVLEQK